METTALEIVTSNTQPQRPKRLVNLNDLWKIFIQMKGVLAKNTLDEYIYIQTRFIKFMSGREMSPQSMVEWMMYLQSVKCRRAGKEKPLSNNHINAINTRVKSFMRWLFVMKYVQDDLSVCIPTLIHDPTKEPVIITEEEYEKIKKYGTGRPWCQVHLWLCILSYRTGMSLVDCCHLKWRDVHLSDNGPSYIDIHRIKTERFGIESSCSIPIVPFSDVHNWLMLLRKAERLPRADGINDYVHQDAPGYYACSFSSIHQDFKNMFKHAGVEPGKTFKHLRSAFCSHLVNSGAQLALICKMTGHNNLRTLLRYLKPDRRTLQDALAKAMHYSASQQSSAEGCDGLPVKFVK